MMWCLGPSKLEKFRIAGLHILGSLHPQNAACRALEPAKPCTFLHSPKPNGANENSKLGTCPVIVLSPS